MVGLLHNRLKGLGLPHHAQADLELAVLVHGGDLGHEDVGGPVLGDEAAEAGQVGDDHGGVQLLLALPPAGAEEEAAGVDMAVHVVALDELKVAGTGLDDGDVLHPGGDLVQIAGKGHRLVAVAGQADIVVAADVAQGVLQAALFALVEFL